MRETIQKDAPEAMESQGGITKGHEGCVGGWSSGGSGMPRACWGAHSRPAQALHTQQAAPCLAHRRLLYCMRASSAAGGCCPP